MPTGRETPQGQCSLTPARVHVRHVCAHTRTHTHTHTHPLCWKWVTGLGIPWHVMHVCTQTRTHTHTHTHTHTDTHTCAHTHPLLQTGHGLGDPLGGLSGRFRLLCGGESSVSVDHPHSPESRTPSGTPPGLLVHNRQTRLQRDPGRPPASSLLWPRIPTSPR